MGHGIAQVFAVAGHDVAVLRRASPPALETLTRASSGTSPISAIDRGAVKRVRACADLGEAVADADIVIEAAPEKLPLKQELFVATRRLASADALIASNTSVIPIGRIAEGSPTRGAHPRNALVEPAFPRAAGRGDRDGRDVAGRGRRMIALLDSVGKTPVQVKKDVPGFVGNRLQHALWREAMALVAEGICDAETVDIVVKASFGRRLAVLGPLENADLVGTDLTLDIHENVLPHIDRTPEPAALSEGARRRRPARHEDGTGFRSWTAREQQELRARVLNHLKSNERHARWTGRDG